MSKETSQPNLSPQPDLSQLDINYDERGRAHHANNGRFISYAHVNTLGEWREFILENAPNKQRPTLLDALAASQTYGGLRTHEPASFYGEEPSESVSHWERAKRKFRWAANELQLLPQTVLDVAIRGKERLGKRAESSPRNRILASVAAAFAIVGAAGKSYASVRYGVSVGGTSGASSPEKHAMFNQLLMSAQDIGGVAVQHHSVSHPSKHELLSQLHYSGNGASGNTSPGKHMLLSELKYSGNTSSPADEAMTRLSNPGKHKLWSELKYDPQPIHGPGTNGHGPHGPNTHGHQHTGFVDREVFVEHGHGVTQELQDMHEQMGIHLTPEQHYAEYQYLVKIHGDNIFVGDPMYTMHNGDFGISHSGHVLWAPGVQANDHRWLKMHGFRK